MNKIKIKTAFYILTL